MRYTVVAALLFACLQLAHVRETSAQAAPNTGNTVAAFLKSAERQSESDRQRKEIQRALRDMLDKSPAQLRQMRYADYAGHPNRWSITELLPHYFVPKPLAYLDDSRFFQDVRAPEARAAIQHQLDEVTLALQPLH